MPATQLQAPPKGQAVVRMYRQGLGDCFLLAFRGDDGSPVYMLIDCGTWDGDDQTLAQMKKVVQDISDSTGGHLHVLVVTHEHWDHVSGFLQAADVFDDKQFRIDEVWLAWTERPGDPLASELRDTYVKASKKVGVALDRLAASDRKFAANVREMLGVDGLAAAGKKADPAAAMKWVRGLGRSKKSKLRFLKPPDVVAPPGTSDARAYVLGPPRNEKALRDVDATEGRKKRDEVYPLRLASRLAESAFFVAAEHGLKRRRFTSDAERESWELALPFDPRHQIRPDDAATMGFFQDHYGFEARQKGKAWRRIDEDWLQVAGHIALWMSDFTNNTSLALAIELTGSGKFLLFVGDAQVGSWLSWQDLKFKTPGAPDGTPPVDWDHVLRNTVLYKVGHHGSHNATLKKDGLDRMLHPDLVAMIPVDQRSLDMGNKKTWKMPRDSILAALRVRTKDRIMRADTGVVVDVITRDGTFVGRVNESSQTFKAFKKRTRVTKEYVEYTVG